MTLLAPLGLLGLLGIVALIIIYIIRPNYQQKFISTTYVWKLSLKYRKKKIPVSKLRNFLLILCQILILTACTFILTQPNKVLKAQVDGAEIVVIIDSSASMRAGDEDTRFERAVLKAQKKASDVVKNGGIVSVILADDKPEFYQQRVTLAGEALLNESFDALLDDGACSYGTSDLNAAIALCEDVIRENPNAEVFVYTDAQFSYVPKTVNVVDVTYQDEWNAAILNAYAEFDENYYAFIVEVDCYGKGGRAEDVEIVLDVQGANAESSDDDGTNISLTTSVECDGEGSKKVIFINEAIYSEDKERFDTTYDHVETIGDDDQIGSYKSVHIELTVEDSYAQDDVFDLYGGQKETIRVQYASAMPNNFFSGILLSLKSVYRDRWDIQITDVKRDEEAAVEGFDFYIFEHTMPSKMPTDGVVFLVNMEEVPSNIGVRVIQEISYGGRGMSLTQEEEHPILNNINADNIEISRYFRCNFDGSYQPILMCDNTPVLAVKNEVDSKVIVMPFSMHYSNLPLRTELPVMMYNLFGYFFPSTVTSNSFEVYETVELNARGQELEATCDTNPDLEIPTFTEFPAYLSLGLPGTYTLTQADVFSGEEIVERVYVRIPSQESNIWYEHDSIEAPFEMEDNSDFLKDLLIYIAAALVFLLFAEWWLKSRDAA